MARQGPTFTLASLVNGDNCNKTTMTHALFLLEHFFYFYCEKQGESINLRNAGLLVPLYDRDTAPSLSKRAFSAAEMTVTGTRAAAAVVVR